MDNGIDSQINVTELWHKYLFGSLMKIQDYERMARDGSVSIEQSFQVHPNDVPKIQFDFLKQMTTEMDILLSNTSIKLDKAFKDYARKEVNSAKQIIDKYPSSILKDSYSSRLSLEAQKFTLSNIRFISLNNLLLFLSFSFISLKS